MRETIFNIHDLVLMMTSIQCVCFVLLLLATNPPNNRSNYWLAAFLITQAFIPMHELVLWGTDFRGLMLENYPRLFFWMGFAYFMDGALLYFYVKSLVYRDFSVHRKDALHLIPVLMYVGFLIATFYSYSLPERVALIEHDQYVYSAPYLTIDFLGKLGRIFYCVASILLILKYKDQLKATHSTIERVDIWWLKLLVAGFLIVTSITAALALAKIVHLWISFHPNLFQIMGLTSYYSVFFLVLILVFSSMRYFATFESIQKEQKQPTETKLVNIAFAEKVDAAMRSQKLYLSPDLTLDVLSETLHIPSKDLSLIFNRHFHSNFYEFINGYRITEAKQMLADPKHKDKTITQIYLEVGFNSKSVFNTFFKKIVGQTPSEFRQASAVASS
jgi:AraC-like DNA-binding protein